MTTSHIQALRAMLCEEKGVVLPGAPNALAARIIADLGFKAVYLTGAGLTNMHLGLPDLGFMDLSQVADHVMAIRCVIDLPLVVDADTGFGNAVNVTHAVRTLEQAGASAIQIEDQRAPKRCGHFEGKELISLEQMVGKVRAAVDTRRHDLVVIARTDACAVEGFEAAIERASRYIEAGADVTFVEAPESLDDLKALPRRLKAPQLVNMVLGGKTPIVDAKVAGEMGFGLVLYANAALQGAVHGMQSTLSTLKEKGALDERAVTSFAERQRLVDKPAYDLMEARYAAHAAAENSAAVDQDLAAVDQERSGEMTNQHPEVMQAVGNVPARVTLSGGGPAGDAGVGNQSAAEGGRSEKPKPIINGQSQAEGLVKFASRITYDDLAPERRGRLKVSILDSLATESHSEALAETAAWAILRRGFGDTLAISVDQRADGSSERFKPLTNPSVVRRLDAIEAMLWFPTAPPAA